MASPNKGMKLTSAERIGRSQLIPGVRRLPGRATMGHQLTLTAVEKTGDAGVQEVPAGNSSVTMDWSEWEAALQLLDAHPEVQEELMAICPDEPGDADAPSWAECIAPAGLARTLRRARQLCGLEPLEDRNSFQIVCVAADGTAQQVVHDQVALVSGDETLLLSVAKGLLTRIDRVKQSASSEPLRDGLQITGRPVGETRGVIAHVEAIGVGPQPTDVLAGALKVCLVARSRRGRVQVTLHE